MLDAHLGGDAGARFGERLRAHLEGSTLARAHASGGAPHRGR
ncbi:hypothetical protein AB0O68_34485 [Streptomyces sp. NPDC087512]